MPSDRSSTAFTILRVTLGGLLAAHGWMRLLSGGIVPFGGWLTSQGVPFGPVVAALITAFEIAGMTLFAFGRFVAPIAAVQIVILTAGIVMVHAKSGWWVVGAGRNGAEYSVLLIVALACVAFAGAGKK